MPILYMSTVGFLTIWDTLIDTLSSSTGVKIDGNSGCLVDTDVLLLFTEMTSCSVDRKVPFGY